MSSYYNTCIRKEKHLNQIDVKYCKLMKSWIHRLCQIFSLVYFMFSEQFCPLQHVNTPQETPAFPLLPVTTVKTVAAIA